MRHKMKNIRNAKPRSKRPQDEEKPLSAMPAKQQKKQYLPRYPIPPKIALSEDNASYQRHIKMLQSEAQKTSPVKRTIMSLMSLTYPFRRQEILEKGMEIANILKIYPPLKKLTRYPEPKKYVQ